MQVFLLIDGLRARGYSQCVVAQPDSQVARAARQRQLPVLEVPMRADWDLRAIERIAGALQTWSPTCVHLHTGRANWLGGWAAKRAGCVAVSTRRMDRMVKRNWKSRRVYKGFLTRTAAISPQVHERLLEAGVAPESTELIWSAVDPARLIPSATRAQTRTELGLEAVNNTRPLLLFAAGALVPRKGFDLLLRALVHGPANVVLCIAGQGPEHQHLVSLTRRLGLEERVRWLGHRKDIANCLQAADGFAMPSKAEGLGIAAIEAMAMGLPVIASRVGGLSELVVPGVTGWSLPNRDPLEWAHALRAWGGDAVARARMGEAAQVRVKEQFMPDRMVDAYERFYRTALADSQQASFVRARQNPERLSADLEARLES